MVDILTVHGSDNGYPRIFADTAAITMGKQRGISTSANHSHQLSNKEGSNGSNSLIRRIAKKVEKESNR